MDNVPMTRPEECLAVHKGFWKNRSTFLELAGGRIIHYMGGDVSHSDDGGITWSEPSPWKDADGDPVGGRSCSLVHLSGEGIGLAARDDELLTMRFWRSEDAGKTWEKPVLMQPQGWTYHAVQDCMIRTSSGRIVLPVWTRLGVPGYQLPWPVVGALNHGGEYQGTTSDELNQGIAGAFVCYSDDDGHTWQRSGESPGRGELIVVHWLHGDLHYDLFNEAKVVELQPGRLFMIARTRMGRLFQSHSSDNGENWTRPEPTMLASSGSPAAIGKVPDTGHLIVIWNQHNEPEIRRGLCRVRLSSAVSRNGGKIWEFFQNVESILEETRVPPGPIHPVRASQTYSLQDNNGWWAEWPMEDVVPLPEGYGRWSYPSMLVTADRVLVSYVHQVPATGMQIDPSTMKVLPLSWFYAGRDRFAESPFLKKVQETHGGPVK